MSYTKCTVEDGKIITCEALDKGLEENYLRAKGLSELVYRNIEDGAITRTAIILRSGEYKGAIKNCIILNYCPFCGEKISSQWFKRKEESGE